MLYMRNHACSTKEAIMLRLYMGNHAAAQKESDMRKVNLHTHTLFCDGRDTPEDMVLSAIEKGFSVLGFSGHSSSSFDGNGCIPDEDMPKYKAEIRRLKEKYKDRLLILCGIEQDYYATQPAVGFDYIIGSVHAFHKGGFDMSPSSFVFVDYGTKQLKEALDKFYNGDEMALAEDYFERVSHVPEKTGCHIIGHFDLLTKFNEQEAIFDENHPRYVAAVDKALSRLLSSGAFFEINTGAMAKSLRTVPYPSASILRKINQGGGRIILSSDSHWKDTVDFAFEDARKLAKSCGFRSLITVGDDGKFTEEDI